MYQLRKVKPRENGNGFMLVCSSDLWLILEFPEFSDLLSRTTVWLNKVCDQVYPDPMDLVDAVVKKIADDVRYNEYRELESPVGKFQFEILDETGKSIVTLTVA